MTIYTHTYVCMYRLTNSKHRQEPRKKCMKIRQVPKVLSFLGTIVSFFSSSRRHQKLLVHHVVTKITSEMNHIYVLLVFVALSLCIVTLFSSGFSKQTHDSEESQCHSDPFLSIIELYPLPHNVDEEMLDETYCLTNIVAEDDDREFFPWLLKVDEKILDETYSLANVMDDDDQEFIPLSHKVDEKILDKTYNLANIMAADHDHEFTPWLHKVDEKRLDETYSLANIVADDDQKFISRSHKVDEEILDETYSLTNIVTEDGDEFIPRLVHLELIEGAIGSHEDYNDVPPHVIHVKLIEGAIASNDESEEFNGFEEDNDYDGEGEGDDDSLLDDGSDSDNDDLTVRIEEFIAKNTRKWREEMLNDRFSYYLEC